MANDFDRLKKEANIDDVVDYLGIQKHIKGNTTFILCPLPAHNDKHATNCYYKTGWNNLYCETCGRSIKAIDFIMYENNCSYGEAADILWNIEGQPDWYHDNTWKNPKKRAKQLKEFRVTGEEANIIGIKIPKMLLQHISYSDNKPYMSNEMPKNCVYDSAESFGYALAKEERVNYKDFMSEKQFKAMVYNKCRERLMEYKKIQDKYNQLGINVTLFKKNIELINNVLLRIKGGTQNA